MHTYSQITDKGYQPMLDKFFSMIKDGKYTDAVDYIYSSNPYMKLKAEGIAQVKTSIQGLPSLVGEYRGYEVLIDQALSSRYVHIDVAVYFDRQPFRFYFDFYKVKDGWMTNTFGYNDDLDEWAKERAKNKYLYFKGDW